MWWGYERGAPLARARSAGDTPTGRGGHLTADEVRSGITERLGGVSVQATYDVLSVLADVGLVRRIEPAGSPTRYESRAGDNHHHLVCRGCGTVVDVACVVGLAPCLSPADDAGFAVDEAEVTFWGFCPACRHG